MKTTSEEKKIDVELEYEIYLSNSNDGNGNDFVDGKPLKTFEEFKAMVQS